MVGLLLSPAAVSQASETSDSAGQASQSMQHQKVTPLPADPLPTKIRLYSQSPTTALPNPLSLDYLLEELPVQSPALYIQNAKISKKQSELLGSEVSENWQLDVEGRLSRRDFADKAQDHHRLALHLGKQLYDFGVSKGQALAAEEEVAAESAYYDSLIQNHKLSVMRAFFNVILADFQYRIDNESMAIEYISFDKTKDRHELGQLSDVDLIEAESDYQQVLLKRAKSEQRQLSSRVALANILGFADARPDEIQMPALSAFQARDAKQLKLEALYQQLEDQNPDLIRLKKRWLAQQTRINALEKMNRPTFRADAWLGKLSSQPEVRDGNWRADLSMEMPLYDGGQKKSVLLAERAKLTKMAAEYEALAQQLREQIAQVYFDLQLIKTEQNVHQIFGDYADLYLDFSRALYENEKATDLGNSMVRLSQANYNLVAWKFKQALLWSKLDLLLGKPVRVERMEDK